MKKALLFMVLFLLGGTLYMGIEVMWRGYTHITMGLAGGISLCLMYTVFFGCRGGMMIKCILCSYCITCVEFIFGCIFNLWLGLNVWDYSDRLGNVLGQICPLYSVLWLFLSIPVLLIFKILSNRTTLLTN